MRYSNSLHLCHLCLWEAPSKLSNSTTGKNKQSGYARPFVVAKQPLCFSLLHLRLWKWPLYIPHNISIHKSHLQHCYLLLKLHYALEQLPYYALSFIFLRPVMLTQESHHIWPNFYNLSNVIILVTSLKTVPVYPGYCWNKTHLVLVGIMHT